MSRPRKWRHRGFRSCYLDARTAELVNPPFLNLSLPRCLANFFFVSSFLIPPFFLGIILRLLLLLVQKLTRRHISYIQWKRNQDLNVMNEVEIVWLKTIEKISFRRYFVNIFDFYNCIGKKILLKNLKVSRIFIDLYYESNYKNQRKKLKRH